MSKDNTVTHFTKTELLSRDGWTEKLLQYWFPVPDEIRRNFHKPSSKMDSKYCIKLYLKAKVFAIELAGMEAAA